MSQIALFSGTTGARGSGTRLDVTYNGITLNHSADSPDSTYELNNVVGKTSFDYVSETNQLRDGLEFYNPRRVSRIETLSGTLRAQTEASYHDKVKALANAFDPVKIAHDNDPTGADPTLKFIALDFSVPTADTTNYASGLVPSRYYALPLVMPDPIISEYTGFAAFFDIPMLIADPRRYWQTQSSKSGAGTIDLSLGDIQTWPTLTITMAGAGNAAYTVTNTTTLHGAVTLTLDLSGLANGDTLAIDMLRRKLTRTHSGTASDYASAYVSGSYFHIDPVASNAITYTNTSNATSVLTYRRAWSL